MLGTDYPVMAHHTPEEPTVLYLKFSLLCHI